MKLRWVASTRGNRFMVELAELVVGAARGAGLDAELTLDAWPEPDGDTVCVAIPHETFPFAPPSPAHLRRTVAVGTEQPGTIWFERAAAQARMCAAVLDISRVGILGLRREGVRAQHLQLGWCGALEAAAVPAPAAERPIDVLYLGSAAARREVLLAGYADALWPYRAALMIPPHWAKPEERADFVLGARKHALVGRAKVLLAVRRQPAPYFEWFRALDAIVGGAALVAEHGAGFAPLVPGEHLVMGGAEGLALLAEGLLGDPAERDRIAAAALAFARAELPMGIPALAAAAETALQHGRAGDAARAREAGRPTGPSGSPDPDRAPVAVEAVATGAEAPPRPPDDAAGAAAARARIAGRRAAERAAAGARAGTFATLLEQDGPAPRVSVLVPAYRAAGTVARALASVAAQSIPVEVLVHDDGCPEGSGAVAAAFLAEHHPELPARVLRRPDNAGLPAGRNALAERARAPYLLMLDADNELLPPCAERLAGALDADPAAAFAYPVLAAHRDGAPVGLLSSLAWDPALLRLFNPIDALALVRADALQAVGGYVDELELYGWEDWDLWCAFAQAGRHGVHVPELLARYARSGGSMLATSDLDQHAKLARLAARHPAVFA